MSALRRFLVDFDAVSPAPLGRLPLPVAQPFGEEPALDEIGEGFGEPSLDLVPDLGADPAVDSVAEAVAVALAEAEATHAAALADLAAEHAAELAEVRARWAAEEGTALAEAFRSAVASLEETLGDAAASALEPLLDEAVREKAVAGLRAAIADLLLAGTGGSIAVAGPADLIEGLRAALDAAGMEIDGLSFTEADTAEVVITADNSRIETRLGAWAGALKRRLEPAADTTAEAAPEDAA